MSDSDNRWGSYLPWFLRSRGLSVSGNLDVFFSRLSQRLERLIQYNEVGIRNLSHFGAWLESESLQRFRFDEKVALATQIAGYFNSGKMRRLAESFCSSDPQEVKLRKLEEQKKILSINAFVSHVSKKVEPNDKKTLVDIEKRIAEASSEAVTTRQDRIG